MSEYPERTLSTAASHRAELLLSRLRTDLRMRADSEGRSREHRTALARAEAAIDAYLSFFYPPDSG